MHKCQRCGCGEPEVQFRTTQWNTLRGKCRLCEKALQTERRRASFEITEVPPEPVFVTEDYIIRPPYGAPKRTLVLGDIHFPYHHFKALQWVLGLIRKLQPDRVVQVGDLADQFGFSKFPKLVKQDPGSELAEAKQLANWLWEEVHKAAPAAECYQLMGNHDDRCLKRALEKAPELTDLVGRSLREFFTFDGVKTIHDSHEELILDGVMYQHGHRSKLGDHARYNQRSTVCGHSHTGGVVMLRNLEGPYFELNAGFLGSVKTEAFSYHAQRKIHTCTLGCGWLDELGPRFCIYPGE